MDRPVSIATSVIGCINCRICVMLNRVSGQDVDEWGMLSQRSVPRAGREDAVSRAAVHQRGRGVGAGHRRQRRRKPPLLRLRDQGWRPGRRRGVLGKPRCVRDSPSQSAVTNKAGDKTRLTAREPHLSTARASPGGSAGAGRAGGFEDVPVAQLPAGQQRRRGAGLACGFCRDPRRAVVLDEPFTAIDVNGVARLTWRMAAHTAQGGMVILTTHQPLPGPRTPSAACADRRGVQGCDVACLLSSSCAWRSATARISPARCGSSRWSSPCFR